MRIKRNQSLHRDIVGNFKVSVSSSSLSVYNSLGNSLSVEMSKFVNEVKILEDDRAIRSDSHAVLVVRDGGST